MSPDSGRTLRLALLPALALYALLAWRLDFVCDDAFISFRYARNLAEGHGLRFNLTTGEDENPGDLLMKQVQVYAYEQVVHVRFPENLEGDVHVYTLLGEEVSIRKNGFGHVEIPVFAENVYVIVKVVTPGGVKSAKVFIRS